jgi:pimeloyl-ACP methyl ester carboxylesterase
MSSRHVLALLASLCALGAPASACAAYSDPGPEKVAWVRRAAGNFVAAELHGNGAAACAILDASLRRTQHGRTCAQRWDAQLARLLRSGRARARLRAQQRSIPSAAVVVHGDLAWIHVPVALMSGQNRFRWTENCWMLQS